MVNGPKMPVTGFSSSDFSGRLMHTSWGHVWLSLPKRGILVYDYNNTPLETDDDQYRFLSKGATSGNLPSLEVEFMAEDENGEIWIGTNLGLRVFFSPRRVFDGGTQGDASEILIQQEGYTEVLFDQESITGDLSLMRQTESGLEPKTQAFSSFPQMEKIKFTTSPSATVHSFRIASFRLASWTQRASYSLEQTKECCPTKARQQALLQKWKTSTFTQTQLNPSTLA